MYYLQLVTEGIYGPTLEHPTLDSASAHAARAVVSQEHTASAAIVWLSGWDKPLRIELRDW